MSKAFYIALSVAIIFNQPLTGQEDLRTAESDFFKFLGAIRYHKTLTAEQVESFIPAEEKIDGRSFKGAGVLAKTNNFWKLLIDYSCSTTEKCTGSLIVTYNPNGGLNSHLVLTERMGNCRVGSVTFFILQNRQMVITKQAFWQDKCSQDPEVDPHDFYIMREYKIFDDGYLKLIHQTLVDLDWKFPDMSTRLLSDLDLDLLKPEDLDYMRNELFAHYGYKFKSTKWNYIFEDKPWYQPKLDEVPREWLSTIERRNLDLILAYHRKK